MMNRRDFLAALAVLSSQLAACGTAPGSSSPRKLAAHPRLIATEADWIALARRRKTDPDLDRLVTLLIEGARTDLIKPTLERKLEGKRLLTVSREFIRRALRWSMAWKVTADPVFLERLRREALAICAFADWNPSHYLDVAEMTTGLAIAYDWLYHDLPESERAAIRTAIIDKGIAQARHGHKTFRLANNWGQVCITGMVLGALALADDEPELTSDLIAAARQDVLIALEAYQPDGVYPEGPAYWNYGTSYSVLLIAALRSVQGQEWGVLDAPGFRRSAEFYAHSIGPSGKHFNFSDGNEGQELATPLFYLARELAQPALLAPKREMIRKNQGLGERFAPLAALWWPENNKSHPPPAQFFGQGAQPVAMWRSSWRDPDALWFAIKAGGAHHNHAHMDAGSFVLDCDGLRWAKDLGMQDYNSLESRGVDLWNMKQDSPRWRVFRLGSDAHNTLTIAGQPHSASGMATLKMAGERETLIDLAPVLGVKQATRRARCSDAAVQLNDEIRGAAPGSEIRWAMATEADVRIEGQMAVLSQKGKTLRITFAGDELQFEVRDISKPRSELDAANPGVRQLLVSSAASMTGEWRLGVRFERG